LWCLVSNRFGGNPRGSRGLHFPKYTPMKCGQRLTWPDARPRNLLFTATVSHGTIRIPGEWGNRFINPNKLAWIGSPIAKFRSQRAGLRLEAISLCFGLPRRQVQPGRNLSFIRTPPRTIARSQVPENCRGHRGLPLLGGQESRRPTRSPGKKTILSSSLHVPWDPRIKQIPMVRSPWQTAAPFRRASPQPAMIELPGPSSA